MCIYCHWCRRLLFLRLICCLSCLGICWPNHEEGLLRIGTSRFDCQHDSLRPRKSFPQLYTSLTNVVQFAAKYFFMRILRGSKHLARNTPTHWIVWFSCTAGNALISYIVASAIPVFGGLVSLIGALLGTLMCLQPMGCMWFYDNWRKTRTASWYFWCGWATFIIVIGWFLTVAGTYGSIVGIIDSYKKSGGSAAWSCADNSNSS